MRFDTAAIPPVSVRFGGPHPLRFGLRRRWLRRSPTQLSDDVRLFAATWVGGFLGFSLFLA